MKKVVLILVLLIFIIGCKPVPKGVAGPGGCITYEECRAYCDKHPGECDKNIKVPASKDSHVKKELCEDDKRYLQMNVSGKPLLSMTFDIEDHSNEYWGMIPFCARYLHGQMHGAMDFELKPDTKVYAAESGVVESTGIGKEEGSGEFINIKGDGFDIGYSGLKNLKFKAGDKVNKGEQIGEAVLIPHGEHHVHMSLVIGNKEECPLKYMDEEFRNAVRKIYPISDFSSQTLDPCACNCESLEKGK